MDTHWWGCACSESFGSQNKYECQVFICLLSNWWKEEEFSKVSQTKGNSIIVGECWAYKSGLGIFVRALEVPFFILKNGHFWQKLPSLRVEKLYFGCPSKNSENTFISQTSPKNDGIAFVLSNYHFLMGFKPICYFGTFFFFLAIFTL